MSESPAAGRAGIDNVYIYLCVRGGTEAMDFYAEAFGADETFRLTEPDGRIGHAEFKIGPVTIMLADEFPEYGITSPLTIGGNGTRIHLHVQDVDGLTDRVVKAGAELLMAPKDQFYGERSSRVRDPFGHEWLLGQHIEDVSVEEMQRRYNSVIKVK